MEKHRTEYALLKMGIKFTIGEILFKKKKKKVQPTRLDRVLYREI